MADKTKSIVSARLRNAMRWNGFWDDAMLNPNYDGDGYRRFFEYCVEYEPEHTKENEWGHKWKVQAGIRWHKFGNFGKKSFAELCNIVGVDPENPTANQEQIDAKLTEIALRLLANPSTYFHSDTVQGTVEALKFALPPSALRAIAKS